MNNLFDRLNLILNRYEELELLMGSNSLNVAEYEKATKEYQKIAPIVNEYQQLKELQEQLEGATAMLLEPEFKDLAQAEIKTLEQNIAVLTSNIKIMLLPKDPNDTANVFLEIRAGTGGDEAALFAYDLYKMYVKYAEASKFKVEIISESQASKGGFKEIILRLSGINVYGKLKFESGAHRVQRVPETESQGRVHTSACTVAILQEVKAIDNIDIKPEELRIDTYRASGAGGQHVNKTDSAVRITHIPTGTVVECQDERSQHKNKAKALALLQAKILAKQQEQQKTEEEATRKSLVGTGDRSDRIRTYNFPQGRITDHRINLTLYQLDEVLNGNLNLVIEPILHQDQIDKLQALGLS